MNYLEYLEEIEERKKEDLHPKPIDAADLTAELISQIKDEWYTGKNKKIINFRTRSGGKLI